MHWETQLGSRQSLTRQDIITQVIVTRRFEAMNELKMLVGEIYQLLTFIAFVVLENELQFSCDELVSVTRKKKAPRNCRKAVTPGTTESR